MTDKGQYPLVGEMSYKETGTEACQDLANPNILTGGLRMTGTYLRLAATTLGQDQTVADKDQDSVTSRGGEHLTDIVLNLRKCQTDILQEIIHIAQIEITRTV